MLLVKSKTRLIVSLINDPKYFDEGWLLSRKIVQHMGKDLFIDEMYEGEGREDKKT